MTLAYLDLDGFKQVNDRLGHDAGNELLGIRFSGMPGWKGILSDEKAWNVVRYIRHLPPKGSLGAPKVFEEAEEQYEHGGKIDEQHKPQTQPHQH